MRELPKIKRKRPNLETAKLWLKVGLHETNPKKHYFSLEERDAEIKEIVQKLQALPRQFPRTQNLEYAVLKFHLIIEHAILQYIRCHARVLIEPEKLKFTFSQKLEIAYIMGLGANDPDVIPVFELVNSARNQVAHTFFLDRQKVDEAIRIATHDSVEFPTENDRQRVKALRQLCKWYCGYVAGSIEGEYWTTRPRNS